MPLWFRTAPKYISMLSGTIREGTPGKSVRKGRCNVCGQGTLFVSPRIDESRNTSYCVICGCSARKRHVAFEILNAFPGGACIRDWGPVESFRMLSTSWDDQFTFFLSHFSWYNFSEYFPDLPSGEEIVKGGYSLDLQATNLNDSTYDLIVTEDVFEHVRDHRKGFLEVHRILKKGGHHIFTVPYMPDQKTKTMVDSSGAEDVFLTEPEYHYGGVSVRDGSFDVKAALAQNKVLAYRTFGSDLVELLDQIGFETKVGTSASIDPELCVDTSFVLVSRKL